MRFENFDFDGEEEDQGNVPQQNEDQENEQNKYVNLSIRF
jgi:hypothetical protein